MVVKRTAQTAEMAERNAQIKQLHRDGLTYREISAAVGLTALRVKDIIRDPYSAIPPQQRVVDYVDFVPPTNMSERAAKMVQMKEEGLTLEEIGKLFGVTRERVRQIINDFRSKAQRETVPTSS